MGRSRKRKCKNCKELFLPDSRNGARQKYCSLPACRKASKVASQKKWLAKPENRNYFSGPDNIRRVQQWRQQHPGYWQKQPIEQKPLQDSLSGKTKEYQMDITHLPGRALQDLLTAQPTVFLGLLAQLLGSPLQDDIVTMGGRLQQLGQDILSQSFCPKGDRHDSQQGSHLSTFGTQGSGTVQLGGSPSGP
jgi:hypothetical protein